MAKNTYKEIIEPSLIYGGIIGGVILLHSVVLQIMNATFSTYSQVMGYILPIGLLTYTLYSYRKEYLGGIMPYSRGLGMGVLFSVVFAMIGTAYLIVLIKFIDPNYLELAKQIAEEKLIKKGYPDEVIEKGMEYQARFMTFGFITIAGFFLTILMGTIFSLIIMIFLKKEPKDPFANVET
jgi:hypothetical protein